MQNQNSDPHEVILFSGSVNVINFSFTLPSFQIYNSFYSGNNLMFGILNNTPSYTHFIYVVHYMKPVIF